VASVTNDSVAPLNFFREVPRSITQSFTQENVVDCPALVESLNNLNNIWTKTYRPPQNHEPLSHWETCLHPGLHLLGVSLVTSLHSNLCTTLTTRNTTESSGEQIRLNFNQTPFLIGIHRLLFTNKRCSNSSLQVQTYKCIGQAQQNFIIFYYCIGARCFDSYRVVFRDF